MENNEEKKTIADFEAKIKELDEKMAQCEKEREEYLNGWKRAKADFLNYQKDEAKRFEEVIKFSNEDFVKELITVLDSFDLGVAALERNGPVEKGVYMIRAQLEDFLKKRGLERIIISVGRQFDPNLHDAVSTIDSDKPSGTIIEEVERGYLLNGKLIRPARVKVAK